MPIVKNTGGYEPQMNLPPGLIPVKISAWAPILQEARKLRGEYYIPVAVDLRLNPGTGRVEFFPAAVAEARREGFPRWPKELKRLFQFRVYRSNRPHYVELTKALNANYFALLKSVQRRSDD